VSALFWRIQNRTYLGETNYGGMTKKNSHPAIVSQVIFYKANAVKGRSRSAASSSGTSDRCLAERRF
jgi:hypothetical protein